MKKLLSLLLTLIMATAAMGLVACKKDDGKGSQGGETGIEYTLDGDHYVVTGFNISNADAEKIADGEYDDIMKDIEIPAQYEDAKTNKKYDVTEIAEEAFLDQIIIKSIKVPSSIEKIGAGAFSGCTNLEEIELPFIGEKVGAVNEKKVFGYIFGTTSKEGATEVKQEYNVAAATTSYYIPNSLTKVIFTGDALPEYAFNAWTTLKDIELPSTLTKIPNAAFKGCTGFNEFTLKENVTEISAQAFSGCNALINFIFNDKLEVIGQNAFENCTSLNTKSNLVFPATLTQIKAKAFKGCTGLVGIDLSKATNLELIGEAAFNGCSAIKEVVLSQAPANDVVIASQAFVGCDKLNKTNLINFVEANYQVSKDAFPNDFFN